jgi:hypothetical protein
MVGVILLAICALASYAGLSLDFTTCSTMVLVFSLAGSILGITAFFRPARELERFIGGALVIYVVIATATGQFANVDGKRDGVFIGVAWLVPLMAGGLILPRISCWLTSAGCWALLFSGMAALTYSASHGSSGIGLLYGWLG